MAIRSQAGAPGVRQLTGARLPSVSSRSSATVYWWAAGQAVAAALAAQPFQKAVLHQDFQDVLQIFFRDILPRGDLLQRDIAFGLMLGQVDHHTQRIAAFG